VLQSDAVKRLLPFALALFACKPEDSTDLPICLNEVAGDEAEESQQGQLPPEIWFQFLLRNYNRKTGLVAAPVKDCSGKLVEAPRPPEVSACLAAGETGAPLPERALVPDDLIITEIEGGRQLVWVKARYFDDGDAIGPVAITQWTKRGIAVRSIGALRAHANRARMRLESMGAGQVLVVESDVCLPDNPKQCDRVMRLLPMVGERFEERPMVLDDGSCVGPAEFALHGNTEVSQPNGQRRSLELTRTVDFTDGNVVMNEAVVIKDRDPAKPDEPAKVYRNASVQRPMALNKAGLVTKPGVWDQLLAEHGSVRERVAPAPK
jgi:hypothetical protein